MDRPDSSLSSSSSSRQPFDRPGSSSSSNGTTGRQANSVTRRPTLAYPAFHLGSFQGLGISDPLPPSSSSSQTPVAHPSPAGPRRERRNSIEDQFSTASSSSLPHPPSLSHPVPRHATVNASTNHPPSKAGDLNHAQQYATTSLANLAVPGNGGRPSTSSSTSSFSSTSTTSPRSRKHILPVQPATLPPPNMSLPPIPSISPISPFGPPSPADIVTKARLQIDVPVASSSRTSSPKIDVLSLRSVPVSMLSLSEQSPASSPIDSEGGAKSKDVRHTPITKSLTIHIPRSLTPPPVLTHSPDEMPTVRDSPSMARRRTVVTASPITSRIASGRATQVANTEEDDDFNPSLSPAPLSAPIMPSYRNDSIRATESPLERQLANSSEPSKSQSMELGSLSMPVPRPSPAVEQAPQFPAPSGVTNVSSVSSPHRLEKKPGSSDLKNASPSSPTPKRSLPRPPSQRNAPPPPLILAPVAKSSGSNAQASSGSRNGPEALPRPPVFHTDPSMPTEQRLSGRHPQQPQAPTEAAQLPPRTASKVDSALPSPDLPMVTNVQQGQRSVSKKSASTMPVVGGLADAGPYPSATPVVSRTQNPSSPNAGPSALGLGRPSQTPLAPSRRPVQEEVCIECMMRDRDLADVVVSGDGVWDRKSDLDWEDFKSREEEVLRSMGSEALSSEIPSLDHSAESDEEDETSLPSTNHSAGMDDLEARRIAAVKLGQREQRRARRRQIDWKIVHDVGWRGFKWEEGAGGEGLPRGFRGSRGGPLTEDAIKAVMRKFPSASAHRAKFLENYLYHQAILVREIRAEAQRIGYFPEPGDGVPPAAVARSERQNVIVGPRTSSVAWGEKHARELGEQMRSAFDKPLVSSSQTSGVGVRPSPSSPADLAHMGSRPQNLAPSRPATHFYPDRETHSAAQRTPVSLNTNSRDLRDSNRKSVGSTKTLDRSVKTDIWAETDEDPWPPISPAESGLRPFSFAVRAGATAGRGSNDGHERTRRSFLGRWGGSVTSFFGGSQGGSGSMMDMHLGLDQDQQDRTSPNNIHGQPRAISLASPTRPSFFGKDSRASSMYGEQRDRERDRKLSKSISTSRLSQMITNEPEEIESPVMESKKKGLKGLLNKMKPKSHRKDSHRLEPAPRNEQGQDVNTPLAPPPPMAYLVNDKRNRSGSTSSMLSDASGVPGQRYLPYGSRSVSAPQPASSSSGSQSASPTSSRYNRRESYASGREVLDSERDRRGSVREVLASETRRSTMETDASAQRTSQYQTQGNYAPHAFRPHSKTTSSFSNSSLFMPSVETPPPGVNGAAAFFAQQSSQGAHGRSLSPNRHKNLPPLPLGQDGVVPASPDSFNVMLPDGHQSEYPRTNGYSPQLNHQYSGSPRDGYSQQKLAPPRASFDPLGDRRNRMDRAEVSPRLAQSMYVQPGAMASAGSFGQGDAWPPKRPEEGKSAKSRRGLKSFFGGAKAGRVA